MPCDELSVLVSCPCLGRHQVEFLVAGTMSITVVEAKRLRKTNKAVGRQDPYVVLKMDGGLSSSASPLR